MYTSTRCSIITETPGFHRHNIQTNKDDDEMMMITLLVKVVSIHSRSRVSESVERR